MLADNRRNVNSLFHWYFTCYRKMSTVIARGARNRVTFVCVYLPYCVKNVDTTIVCHSVRMLSAGHFLAIL